MKYKKDGISLEEIVAGLKDSVKSIYKKKIKIPTMKDIGRVAVNLNYSLSEENREQIEHISSLFTSEKHKPDSKNITPWMLGYVSGFSYLIFSHIGKEKDFEKKPAIIVFIYSEVFNISKSKAEKLFYKASKEFLETTDYVDGSYSSELDYNSSVISRDIPYLYNWREYIIHGKYPSRGTSDFIKPTRLKPKDRITSSDIQDIQYRVAKVVGKFTGFRTSEVTADLIVLDKEESDYIPNKKSLKNYLEQEFLISDFKPNDLSKDYVTVYDLIVCIKNYLKDNEDEEHDDMLF